MKCDVSLKSLRKLDSSILPKKSDIKYCVFLFDKTRSSWKISSCEKVQIREDLLSFLVSILESKGLSVLDKKSQVRKYDRLINDADYLGLSFSISMSFDANSEFPERLDKNKK